MEATTGRLLAATIAVLALAALTGCSGSANAGDSVSPAAPLYADITSPEALKATTVDPLIATTMTEDGAVPTPVKLTAQTKLSPGDEFGNWVLKEFQDDGKQLVIAYTQGNECTTPNGVTVVQTATYVMPVPLLKDSPVMCNWAGTLKVHWGIITLDKPLGNRHLLHLLHLQGEQDLLATMNTSNLRSEKP